MARGTNIHGQPEHEVANFSSFSGDTNLACVDYYMLEVYCDCDTGEYLEFDLFCLIFVAKVSHSPRGQVLPNPPSTPLSGRIHYSRYFSSVFWELKLTSTSILDAIAFVYAFISGSSLRFKVQSSFCTRQPRSVLSSLAACQGAF